MIDPFASRPEPFPAGTYSNLFAEHTEPLTLEKIQKAVEAVRSVTVGPAHFPPGDPEPPFDWNATDEDRAAWDLDLLLYGIKVAQIRDGRSHRIDPRRAVFVGRGLVAIRPEPEP